MVEGDEPIGNIQLIEGGMEAGLWKWSMMGSLRGPHYSGLASGTEPSRGTAARRMIELYQHYLSTRPE
jgi:hypothetical protein